MVRAGGEWPTPFPLLLNDRRYICYSGVTYMYIMTEGSRCLLLFVVIYHYHLTRKVGLSG